MKIQTYISYLEDENGNMLTFERWPYKRMSTILKKLDWLYNENRFVYDSYIKKAKYLTVYATPDGYKKEVTPEYKILVSEFCKTA